MASFNLDSTSSQNYYTVVGENISFPIDMADLEVLWESSNVNGNNYQSIGDFTSSGNYALNGLISEIITVAGREAYYTFEDLSGLTAEYNFFFSGYEDRVGNARILSVSEVSYSDGTSLDRISIYYDASSSMYNEEDFFFENDYLINLYGSLSFDTYTDETVYYSFDLKSYQKQYQDFDILGVLKDPLRMNLYQEDPSSFVYDANGNRVAASLIGGSIKVNDKEQNTDLDSLGFIDFTNPLETEGINIYFEDNPFVYNDYLDNGPPSYDNDTFSGSVSSLEAFKQSHTEQGIDILRADLGINSFLGSAMPNFIDGHIIDGYLIDGNTTISEVELTHGYGPFTFDFRTMGVTLDSDTSSSYSASFNPSDNITLGNLSSETPLYDLFKGDDTLNLDIDTHGQTIFAGGGNDTVYAGLGNDIIYGNGGIDTIYANDGDDQIIVNDGFYSQTNAFEAGTGYNFLISESSYRTDNTVGESLGSPDIIDGGEGIDTLVFEDSFTNIVTIEEGRFAQGTGSVINLSFRSTWYDDIDYSGIPLDSNYKYVAYTNDFEVNPFSSQTIEILDDSNLAQENNPDYQNESYELTNVEYLEINGQLYDIRPLYLAQAGDVDETLYAFNSETWLDLYGANIVDETSKYFFLGLNGAQYFYVEGLDGDDTIYGTDLRGSTTVVPYLNRDDEDDVNYGDFWWDDLGYFTDGSRIIDSYMGEALNGGDGNDTLIGGAGADIYFVNVAADTIVESARDDDFDIVIFAPNTSGLTYTIANNAAVERLFVNRIYIDPVTGEVFNNEFVNLPSNSDQVNITGGNYTYELIGHNGANIITAGSEAGLIAQPGEEYASDVILIGLGGDDTLIGGSGEDNFFSGSGNDVMEGGADSDTFYFGLNNLDQMPEVSYGDFSDYDSTFGSAIFDEYFFDHPQELTGGHDRASGGEGDYDRVVVISPLWDQPAFQRTSNDAITLSTVSDSLRVDNTTEFIQNYTFDENNPFPYKVLPFVWETIDEPYVITPAYSYQEQYIASYTSVPRYATVKRKQVLQGYNQVPNYATRTVEVEAVIGHRYYPDEKAIFEKINALDIGPYSDFIFVAPSEYNDFIVASSLDDGITFSNDLGLTSYNINGGDGNDMIFASAESNWIRGGTGQDFLYTINAATNIDWAEEPVETVPVSIELTFDANNDVADGDDSIRINNHGLVTGQAVIYDDGGDSSALGGGLANADGTTFYVIVVDDDHIKLSISSAGAMNGEPITIDVNGQSAIQSLTFEAETILQTSQSLYGDAGNDTLTADLSLNYRDINPSDSETITFDPSEVIRGSFGNINWDINTETLDGTDIYFMGQQPFNVGDRIIYKDGNDGSIYGLTDSSTYYVTLADSNFINISSSPEGTAISLYPNSDIDFSNGYGFTDFYTYTFEIKAHGFSSGDQVIYGDGYGDDGIDSLTDDETYYVIKIDDNNFQLASSYNNALDNEAINVLDFIAAETEYFSGSDHSFTYTPTPYLPYHFNLDGGAGDDTYRIKASFNEAYLSTFDITDTSGSNSLIYVANDGGDSSFINGIHSGELFFQWDINKLNAINSEGNLLSSIEKDTISRFIISHDSDLFTPLYSYNLINPEIGDYLDGTILGSSDNDLFFSINGVTNKFYGGDGNDLITLNEVNGGIASGGRGNNIINIATAAVFNRSFGNQPVHTLSYEWTSQGMSSEIDLSVGFGFVENTDGTIIATDQIDSEEHFKNVTGGNANDTIIGNQYQNILIGGGGDDTLYAGNNIHSRIEISQHNVDQNTDIISYQNHGFRNGEYVWLDGGNDGDYQVIFIDKNHFRLEEVDNDITYDFQNSFFDDYEPDFIYITSFEIEGGDLLQGGAGNDTLVDDSNYSFNEYIDIDFDFIEFPVLEGGSGDDTYIIQYHDHLYDDFKSTLIDERASNGLDSGGIDTVRLERDNQNRSIWSSEEVSFNIAFNDDTNYPPIEIAPIINDWIGEVPVAGINPYSAFDLTDDLDDSNGLYLKTIYIDNHGLDSGDRVRIDFNRYDQPVELGYFDNQRITTTSDQIVDNLYLNTDYYVVRMNEDSFALAYSLNDALNIDYYGEDRYSDLVQFDNDGVLNYTAGTFKIIKESTSSINFTTSTSFQKNQTLYADFHNQLDYIYGETVNSTNYYDYYIESRDKFYNISEANGGHYELDYLASNDFSDDEFINPDYFDFLQYFPYTWNINSADIWSKTENSFKDFNEVSYIQSGTTVTIVGEQNYVVGDHVMLNFSNSAITDGLYRVSALTDNGFKVNVSSSASSSGIVAFSDHIFDGYHFTWLDESYVAVSHTSNQSIQGGNLYIDYYLDIDNHPVITESSNNIQAIVDKNALEYIDFATTDNQSLSYKYKVSFDRGTDNINPEVIISSQEAGSYLFGNAGTDIIFDTSDSDILLGGRGNDFIQSLSGLDLINGGDGDDVIHFRSEGQIAIGGKGADEFRVSGTWIDTTGTPSRELSTVDFSSDELTIYESESIALIKDFSLNQDDSINLSRDFLDKLYMGYNEEPSSEFNVGFSDQNDQFIFYLGSAYNVRGDYDIYGLFKIEDNTIDYMEALSIQDDLNQQLTEYSLSTFNSATIANNWAYGY